MKPSGTKGHRPTLTVAMAAAVVVIGAGVGIAANSYVNRHRSETAVIAGQPSGANAHSGQSGKAGPGASQETSTSTKSGARGGKGQRASLSGRSVPSRVADDVKPAPLVVTAVTPGSGTTGVAVNAPLTVSYSEPLSATPPLPTLSPAVGGSWTASGSVLTFVPTGGWAPYATETVTVPAGATAIVDGHRTTSTAATTTTFQVAPGSQTRLEQMLAELKYLPFTFARTGLPAGTTSALAAEPTQADEVSTSPLPGTLNWAYPNIPPSLSALWTPGQANVIDKGAIMAFQSAHNLTMDGIAGPKVWATLIQAVAAHQATTQPYDYLMATEKTPETLQVWRNGQIIYTTPSNTGVPGATTQPGTFPVYLREQSGTMKGTNVDGTKYVDPGIPWIAYFNGSDAVHGYVRSSYGFPQSNGCVELPVPNAAQVWTMDPYGTLVTVLPPS